MTALAAALTNDGALTAPAAPAAHLVAAFAAFCFTVRTDLGTVFASTATGTNGGTVITVFTAFRTDGRTVFTGITVGA